MKKNRIRLLLLAVCISLFSGCGCGSKEEKPEEEQVLKISITPAVTPTQAPEEINPDAVVTNGSVTMVNGYLADPSRTMESSPESTASQEGQGEKTGSEDDSEE